MGNPVAILTVITWVSYAEAVRQGRALCRLLKLHATGRSSASESIQSKVFAPSTAP